MRAGARAALVYDYRGTGGSPRPAGWKKRIGMKDWALIDLPAAARALDAVSPDHPMVGVGQSYGGQALGLSGISERFVRYGMVATMSGYWRGLDYVGLGCGAWGTVTRSGQRIRYRNRPQPEGYMDSALGLGVGCDAERRSAALRQLEHEAEPLSAAVQLQECLLLGLRLADGVDLERAAARIGADPWPPARRRAAQRLIERGRLLQQGSRLVIPKPAWLFSDGIISELL